MKTGFMKHIMELIKQSDLVIEVLDARHPEKTRNIALEKMTEEMGKKLLMVMNKADLVEKKEAEEKKASLSGKIGEKVIFISALEKDGINMIRREIAQTQKEKEKTGNGNEITIGIIGYPNVGKSTLINALAGKGRGRVATSRKAGLTRGITKVKISDGIYLIDSPGIIPKGEDEFDLFLVESKNPNQLKDIEGTATKLIQQLGKEKIAKAYEIQLEKIDEMDEEELLEEIAKKKGYLRSGGKADYARAARELLEKYQRHEIN
jgi:ribosome biogenesis GTPase A